MLTLPIKKKWYDMILSGEKKEEYREIKPYWTKRFYSNLDSIVILDSDNTILQGLGFVKFKNGYRKDSPAIESLIKIYRGYGKEDWGAEPNKEYYVLKILSVEEMK